MNLHRTVAVVVAVLGVLAPAPASARITIGKGIAGVAVGDGMSSVRKGLGRPKKVHPPAWVYGRPLVGEVEFDHRRQVHGVWTTSSRQRTRQGIGPGSSLRAARHAYPHLRCHSKGRFELCVLRRRHHHKMIATDFLFRGRLRVVNIHLVPKPGGTPIPK